MSICAAMCSISIPKNIEVRKETRPCELILSLYVTRVADIVWCPYAIFLNRLNSPIFENQISITWLEHSDIIMLSDQYNPNAERAALKRYRCCLKPRFPNDVSLSYRAHKHCMECHKIAIFLFPLKITPHKHRLDRKHTTPNKNVPSRHRV